MGWTNGHLFNFSLDKLVIELPTKEGAYFDAILPEDLEKLDASKTILSQLSICMTSATIGNMK